MLVTKEDCDRFKLPDDFVGLKWHLRYQRVGGVVVCKECNRFLGFPKKVNREVFSDSIPNSRFQPTLLCPNCLTTGRIIHAVPTGVTHGWLWLCGKLISARTTQSDFDDWNPKVAHEVIKGRLLKKVKAFISEDVPDVRCNCGMCLR